VRWEGGRLRKISHISYEIPNHRQPLIRPHKLPYGLLTDTFCACNVLEPLSNQWFAAAVPGDLTQKRLGRSRKTRRLIRRPGQIDSAEVQE
jgi:hypothetical protein